MKSARRDGNNARDHAFREELAGGGPEAEAHAHLDDLKSVRLTLSAELGHCRMMVREVLDLKRGTVLPLEKLAGEMCDMHINDVPFARGEVVVLGDALHIRIAEIIGANERDV